MEHPDPVAVVRSWHDAVNARDVERVLRLSDPEIEIVGPRGSGFGHDLLRQWLDHARVEMAPLRTFARGDTVVVAQHGTWRSPENGEVMGEADVASIFRVAAGRAAYYARHDTLALALEAAGLREADEAPTDGAGSG